MISCTDGTAKIYYNIPVDTGVSVRRFGERTWTTIIGIHPYKWQCFLSTEGLHEFVLSDSTKQLLNFKDYQCPEIRVNGCFVRKENLKCLEIKTDNDDICFLDYYQVLHNINGLTIVKDLNWKNPPVLILHERAGCPLPEVKIGCCKLREDYFYDR